MDSIVINDLEVFGNHGVFQEENNLGQKFLVSCRLEVDTRKAGRTDDLDESVDYGTISHLIYNIVKNNTFALIEKLAETIADEILQYDQKIKGVEITVKKPWAPIGLPLKDVLVKIERKWHRVYIALGSNLGDKKAYLDGAVEELHKRKDCRVVKCSKWIETEPYGYLEQDTFMNGALCLDTLADPYELLDILHEIEHKAQRERKIHWGPRTLDLDILFYDDLVLGEEDLCIPHVDMKNRDFVLSPLEEIAPYKHHPIYGLTVKEMLEELKNRTTV